MATLRPRDESACSRRVAAHSDWAVDVETLSKNSRKIRLGFIMGQTMTEEYEEKIASQALTQTRFESELQFESSVQLFKETRIEKKENSLVEKLAFVHLRINHFDW
ncbi:hypothetical protein ACTXT7_012546 [Hymenolepis weldensis]